MSTRSAPLSSAALLLAALAAGCATPAGLPPDRGPGMVLATIAAAGIRDGRAAFRDVFCRIVVRDGVEGACERWLQNLDEAPLASAPPSLTHHSAKTDVVIVPGAFHDCVGSRVQVLDDASEHLRKIGYRVDVVATGGRADVSANADIIAAHVRRHHQLRPERGLVFVAYSKGTVDTLAALERHADIAPRITALLSIAGMINGTAVAESLTAPLRRLVDRFGFSDCDRADGDFVAQTQRMPRMSWLATLATPPPVPVYSIVALPNADQVSPLLAPWHAQLSRTSRRNDGVLFDHDAIVAHSTLLAYANADHFSIALPWERLSPRLHAWFIQTLPFPRAQLIEAALLTALQAQPRDPGRSP